MQKSQNILHYKGLGDVSYVRSQRARKLSIRINQRGEVRVSIPRLLSQKQAERFFLSRKDWVLKQLNAMNHTDCRGGLPQAGGTLEIRGKTYLLNLLQNEDNIETAIWRVLHEEARLYLPGRVRELSEEHGYKISGLKIRKMLTRWGSCTSRKSINLNSWLVMLPEYLSDYVILHELVHTKIPDHSPGFWKKLDELTGGHSKLFKKELRSHRIMCFPA